MSACVKTPVSWLKLELYQLGELPASERAQVAAHLEACPSCRAHCEAIEGDRRPLRPLPEVAVEARQSWWSFAPAWRYGLAAALATCMIALVVGVVFRGRGTEPGSSGQLGIKGGGLSLVVIRERDGEIVENPDRYLSGDRIALELTCADANPLSWDVYVFQGDEVFFPYEGLRTIRCGNRVALPGAFRLDGALPTTICVALGPDLPSRRDIARDYRLVPKRSACVELQGLDAE